MIPKNARCKEHYVFNCPECTTEGKAFYENFRKSKEAKKAMQAIQVEGNQGLDEVLTQEVPSREKDPWSYTPEEARETDYVNWLKTKDENAELRSHLAEANSDNLRLTQEIDSTTRKLTRAEKKLIAVNEALSHFVVHVYKTELKEED